MKKPYHLDAIAFVRAYFAEHNYGFTPVEPTAFDTRGATGDEVDAVDVEFTAQTPDNSIPPIRKTITIWYNNDGHTCHNWPAPRDHHSHA